MGFRFPSRKDLSKKNLSVVREDMMKMKSLRDNPRCFVSVRSGRGYMKRVS